MRRKTTGIAVLLMVAILGYVWYAGNLLSAIGGALDDPPNRAPAATETPGKAVGGRDGRG